MARDKDFKRLVRERMATTGERYTVARAGLRPAKKATLPPDEIEELRSFALAGLNDPDWRVRRRAAQILDDLMLTDETIAALTNALTDAHPQVRKAALHSLVCEPCKPEKCDIDIRAICESMIGDPSADVRRQAIASYRGVDDENAVAMLERIREQDSSPRVRDFADELLQDKARRQAGEQLRRTLAPELQRKTLRHPGKWVAIADGRIIAAERFGGQIRRAMRGNGRPDALICWVWPQDAGDAD